MITLHELNRMTPMFMNNVFFMERVNQTKSLLTALGVLSVLRAKQHEQLHNNFAALFVVAHDKGGQFELSHVSTFYSVKAGLPSKTYVMLQLMEAKGLLLSIGEKQWQITPRLELAVGPLEGTEQTSHGVSAE